MLSKRSHTFCTAAAESVIPFEKGGTPFSQTSLKLDGEPVYLKASFLDWVIANPEEGRRFKFSTRSVFKNTEHQYIADVLA